MYVTANQLTIYCVVGLFNYTGIYGQKYLLTIGVLD